MEPILAQVEWLLLVLVLLSAVLSVLQVASLLSFYGILVLFMKPETIVPVATIFFLSMNVTKLVLFRSEVDWKLARALVLASAPGVLIGAYLLAFLPSELVRKVVCALVIAFLLVEFFELKILEVKNTKAAVVVVGTGYGLLSGFLGSGSIVRTPLLLQMKLSKGAFVGTAATASLFSNVIKVFAYGANGLMSQYVVVNGALCVIVGIAGGHIGKRFIDRMSEHSFSAIVRGALLVSAIVGLMS